MKTHITGKCPHCKSGYRLRAHAAGRRARCKACKQVFVIPESRAEEGVEEDVASWLSAAPDDDLGEISMDDDDEEHDVEDSDLSPPLGMSDPGPGQADARPRAH
jgi:predicted Zn finger-like uncharacterized protein